ncbi:MAG: A/G-specific adenine glycosylase [Candidatus Brocadiaceae bacterium]|nr:A/G-specific adenine glycosylase [Candidatus Brocadiaceae bacterium]
MKKRYYGPTPKQAKRKNAATPVIIQKFQELIYGYYKIFGRNLPWRNTYNPYHILVSEIMLQQTQVQRVLGKYNLFLKSFPDFPCLAQAPLQRVLEKWQGLGYNRRAIALQKIAQRVEHEYQGTLPSSVKTLTTFPGIGKATASAISAFAFQKPTVFIETNIRRVFIHCFFQDQEHISDAEILPLVERTLDTSNPREWYYALMDYGVMLKREYENPNRKSAHYQRQSPFQGSNRQVRGMVLKMLTHETPASIPQMIQRLKLEPKILKTNLMQLQKEGFLTKKGNTFRIA